MTGTPGAEPPAMTPEPAPAAAPATEPAAAPAQASPAVASALAVLRRVPFTIAYIVLALVLGIATSALWTDLERLPAFSEIAYGLPALEAGRWLTPFVGPFFALSPGLYLVSLVSFALLTGFAEWRLGTLRTVGVAVGVHLATVLLVTGLLAAIRGLDWTWAQAVAGESDAGFSAGMLGVFVVAGATLANPWRLRLWLGVTAYVVLALALVGQLADLVHLVAVALALPLATRLAGGRAVPAGRPASERELRQVVAIGLVAVAGAQIVVHAVPDRLTPFGPADHTPWTGLLVVVALGIALAVARALLRGRRWAWWIAVVLSAVPAGLAVLVLAAGAGETVGLAQLVAGATMHLAFLGVLVVARPAFRPVVAADRLDASGETPDTARRLLRAHGGSSISWMTTWPRMRHLVTADGEGFIGFREHAGVAIALGDPVGPPGTAGGTFDEFMRRAEAGNVIPFLFSCTGEAAALAAARGWRTVQIAEDNIIDLPDLEFTGKKWQAVRTALNKAPKEGIEFRIGALADEPPEILAQVERVSEAWLGEKALPEMGFTLGGVPEALDREVRVGLAVDGEGRVHGITSWLPAYRRGGSVEGWTLDVMRRIEFEGNFRPTMEFLIASSCLAFKAEGASYVSLSGAPLARTGAAPEDDGPVEKVLDMIGAAMEPMYGFRSLHQFKAKFQPRLVPMLMGFRDEADLPRIGIAITRAFLPDAGAGDMAAVVATAAQAELVRLRPGPSDPERPAT